MAALRAVAARVAFQRAWRGNPARANRAGYVDYCMYQPWLTTID
jgi:hypothetical protein